MIFEQTELKERLQWLIKLRWAGCIGVFVATDVVRVIAGLDFPLMPVYLILGFVAVYNVYFQRRLKFPYKDLQKNAAAQISLDFIALTAAVYFSGGCDSPFLYYYIFHIVVSGIILPPEWAFQFTAFAISLPSLVFLLKHFGYLPHFGIFKNRPVPLFSDIYEVWIYGGVFVSTLVLTAYFTTYLSDKLRKKQDEIRSLYIAKSNLIANLSYEIKTPLNTIREFISLLSDKCSELPAEKRARYTGRIDKAVSHIDSLLNDIMALSEIEAGKMHLSLSPFKIADLIRNAAEMFSLKAKEKGSEILLDTEDVKETLCRGDAKRVMEVLAILLDNAIKFTPHGGKVGIKAKTVGSNLLEITVWDTGEGIASDKRWIIFEAYEQLYENFTKRTEGAGLGLSIAKKIVELHGGSMWAESKADIGSKVIFTLPVNREITMSSANCSPSAHLPCL
jgi:signal transduction histidine kinase